MNRFYRVIHALAQPIFHLFTPFRAKGLERLPEEGTFVLCANHASLADPILICLSLPRRVPIRVMGKKELFENRFLGWFLGKLGVFPVDRGNADLNAVKTAMKAVRGGENLLVFPEGTRVAHAGDVRAKGGVVMIAMRTGAPLVPVYSGGKKRLFRRRTIVFGEPWRPVTAARHGTAEEYQAFADEVMRRAYALAAEGA